MAQNSDRKMAPHEALDALNELQSLPSCEAARKALSDIEEYMYNHKCYEASAALWKGRALAAELRMDLAVKNYPDLMEAVLTAIDKKANLEESE